MANDTDAEIEGADEAFLSFGGWAKAMPNPPGLHETRRYTVDVECTAAGIGTSEKGERHTRKLSILRVSEVTGVVVPRSDDDENQAALFDADTIDPAAEWPTEDGDVGEAATVTPLFQGAGDE